MKDIGTVTIAFAAISVVCVLIICFGFLTPLLTEGMPIVECTAKGAGWALTLLQLNTGDTYEK